MKKYKKYIWILMVIGIATCVIVTFILYKKGWFHEIIPINGYSEYKPEQHREDEEYKEYLMRYKDFWIDGKWNPSCKNSYILREGMTLAYDIDCTIQQGSFKIVVFDIGKETDISLDLMDEEFYHLEMFEKVYEEEFTKTGSYHIDFDMMEPDELYEVVYLEPADGNGEYTVDMRDDIRLYRWQLLYDSYIGGLPCFWKKYDGGLNFERYGFSVDDFNNRHIEKINN